MENATQVLGQSGRFLDALERASELARLDRPIVVVGERGTGKALVAERLHRLSDRWHGPLVTASCAILAADRLFGDGERGGRARAGLIGTAAGGTLVLDGVEALSPASQLRLLQALERRAGADHDVRVVATTAAHLPTLVADGAMRADLLDRLAFAVIPVPALRDRGGDALLLAHHHGRRMAAEIGRDGWHGFGEEAVATLTAHRWPGNIRELRTVVERSVAAWDRPDQPVDRLILDPFAEPAEDAVPPSVLPIADERVAEPVGDLRAATAAFERQAMADALDRCRFNGRAAAKALGLTYDQFRHTARKHGLL